MSALASNKPPIVLDSTQFTIGEKFMIKGQLFTLVEVGDTAIFLKRHPRVGLDLGNAELNELVNRKDSKFYFGERVLIKGVSFVFTADFEEDKVIALTSKKAFKQELEKASERARKNG